VGSHTHGWEAFLKTQANKGHTAEEWNVVPSCGPTAPQIFGLECAVSFLRISWRQVCEVWRHFRCGVVLQASCTPAVEEGIIKLLQLQNPLLIKGGFNRPNLQYTVRQCHTRLCTGVSCSRATHCMFCLRNARYPGSCTPSASHSTRRVTKAAAHGVCLSMRPAAQVVLATSSMPRTRLVAACALHAHAGGLSICTFTTSTTKLGQGHA
jgi:hypothetical protein